MRARLAIPLVCLSVALGFVDSAAAQTYGLGDQILTLTAADFVPVQSGQTYSISNGDGYMAGPGTFQAAVRLPDGAQITLMCLYVYDVDSSGSNMGLLGMYLPAGGQNGGVFSIDGVQESFDIGYGTVCTEPMSYTMHSDAGFYGNPVEHVAHFLWVSLNGTTHFGGVRITWHRQISDPPASPTFADVPSDAFGFQHIEALAASGITSGCGSGNYCPNAPITRAQMAVFLSKALGLYWAF